MDEKGSREGDPQPPEGGSPSDEQVNGVRGRMRRVCKALRVYKTSVQIINYEERASVYW